MQRRLARLVFRRQRQVETLQLHTNADIMLGDREIRVRIYERERNECSLRKRSMLCFDNVP